MRGLWFAVGQFETLRSLEESAPDTIWRSLRDVPTTSYLAAGPPALLAEDRRTFWKIALASALGPGLWIGVTAGFGVSLMFSRPSTTAGLYIAISVGFGASLAIGLGTAMASTAWGAFAIARLWLAVSGRLPWRLMSFLADAHTQRGVLRQVGGAYEFRHVQLQQRLAAKSK
jgi:hypothetical protein